MSSPSVLHHHLHTLCFHSKPRMAISKKSLMAMVYIHSAFILIFLSSLCQSNDQLTQTKPLLLEDMLISEGGDFALGFFSPTNSSKKLYIGIWYHRIAVAERTVVWVANRDNPITTPSAKLAITDNLELVLSDSQGYTLWTATGNTSGAASAVLLNSGNFVLRLPNGTEVWQSFDHPTDTILPTMRILLSYKTQPATHLFAWKGPDDPSTGDISSGMDSTNLQMFIWKGALPYYRFPVVNGMAVAGDMYQQSNGNAVIIYETWINAGDELYYKYTVSPGSPYIRFLFDYTGKVRLLRWNSTTSSWAAINELPRSCDLYASCGPFSYCDQMGPLPTTCRCPDGFELLDSLNFSSGCRRKEELKCGAENYFMAMPSMKVPDKFLHIKNRTFDQCVDECTRNCPCMAYAYANLSSVGVMGDTSRCLVWNGDLIDMEKIGFSEVLYIRLGGSPVQRKSNLLRILLPIISCVLLLMLGALVWTCKSRGKRQMMRFQKRRMYSMLEYLSSTDDVGDKNIDFPFISFESIVTATDNFSESNLIGEGDFGKVYKHLQENQCFSGQQGSR